ncbi:MAG: SEC-C domain-containing protein, partial [Clostridia bacterium]|nr:SEC-C domain-containing protein [Clostridia bacterium]
LLQNVDRLWMDHLDAMNELKGSVGLNAYAQRNPIVEYKIQGSVMFDEMVSEIQSSTATQLLSVFPKRTIERKQVAKITGTNAGGGDGSIKKKPAVNKSTVGPNDPCPCGSGKKYKKCCGLKENA